MIRITRKRVLYTLLFTFLTTVIAALAAGLYFKRQWLKDTPNTLAVDSELVTSFRWGPKQDAMLIPVRIEGFSTKFHMQFDTGSASTFLRSQAVEALMARGMEVDLFRKDEGTYIKSFEFAVGDATIVLKDGYVRGRTAEIDWDNPNASNLIGTIGADFLDQKVCEIDFPGKQLRLHSNRPKKFDGATFTPFAFKGRRIILPVRVAGGDEHVFWDSGCSSFGLLTSAYYYHKLTDADVEETRFNANRHGDPVFIHRRESAQPIEFGSTSCSIKNIAYANLYEAAQTAFGRFSGLVGFIGFLGNQPFNDCTLVIDSQQNEFLVIAPEAD
ncbi:MAG: hypothetical protein AB8G99_00675 [Planctomycetaceae bacterium]